MFLLYKIHINTHKRLCKKTINAGRNVNTNCSLYNMQQVNFTQHLYGTLWKFKVCVPIPNPNMKCEGLENRGKVRYTVYAVLEAQARIKQ